MPPSTPASTAADRAILLPAAFLALILILIGAVPPVVSQRVFDLSERTVNQTDELTATGQRIVRLLVDQESSQRGYVITGDVRFLEPYDDASAELDGLWSAAEQEATRVDGAAPGLNSALRAAADDWRSRAAEPEIALVRAGRQADAAAAVASGQGRELFDRLRVRADALDQYLGQVREQQRAERARWVGILNASGVAVAVLGLIGIALIYHLAVRSRRYLIDAAAGEAANLAKDEFLAIASHELKTPVTSIKGHAQMLLRQHGQAAPAGATAPAQWERALRHASAIDRQSTRLTRLIEQLLEVTGAESKVIALEPEPTDLVGLASQVAEQFRPIAPLHPISVAVQQGGVSAEVDRHRIEQVLFNLIDNAIKYAPEGGAIEIVLSRDDRFATCAVRDHGLGVARAEQALIFDRFYRATNVIGTSISGMGVGLYISRAIVLRHGGRIWIESEPGFGSSICFTVPLHT